MTLYRVVLRCTGIPDSAGAEAATDIAREFEENRPWHTVVGCRWDGTQLMLEGHNDFDADGLALLQEFSDCIAAYVPGTFGYEVSVVSVSQVEGR